jgi:hypothetical protein
MLPAEVFRPQRDSPLKVHRKHGRDISLLDRVEKAPQLLHEHVGQATRPAIFEGDVNVPP